MKWRPQDFSVLSRRGCLVIRSSQRGDGESATPSPPSPSKRGFPFQLKISRALSYGTNMIIAYEHSYSCRFCDDKA